MAEVKVLQLAMGCDLIGSKMSLGNRENHMVERAHGIEVTSKKTKRVMLVPFTNIKAYEIIPESEGVKIPAPKNNAIK